MTFGSLFAGIGGMDLGLERAGMQCAWQVEIDDYCRRVLEKHWPNVRRWDDVRTFPPEGDWRTDLICGGFPCTDISCAGPRTGINGSRSGVWTEFARIIRILRPRYVLVENVSDLLVRGIDRVLGDLAECGYDAEWSCLSACAMGAPHARNRVFILAYPKSECEVEGLGRIKSERLSVSEKRRRKNQEAWELSIARALRISDRATNRVDRLRLEGIGNCVVPKVATWIGRQILRAEGLPDK